MNSMNDLIKLEAEKIKKKLAGSRIYGYPVDLDDIDCSIVAAYYMAQIEEIEKRINATTPPPDKEYNGEGVA